MLPSNIRSMVPGLKEKYGSIYALDVSEFGGHLDTLLIRAMSRSQFNGFTEAFLLDPVEAVRNVIKFNVFGYADHELNNMKAGIDEYLCSAVSTVSGFASEESLAVGVEEGRNYASSLEAAITIYICKAFPSLTPKDVDDMTLEDQMRHVSLAEQMLGKEVPYAEYLNPKASKKDTRAKIPDHLMREEPPANTGYQYSHGGGAKAPPVMPPSAGDQEVVVTAENLQEVMRESREMFGGGPQ